MRRPCFAGLAFGLALALALPLGGIVLAGNRAAQNYRTTGGTIDRIGGTLEVMPGGTLRLDRATTDLGVADPKTATAAAGAATLNKLAGIVTSEALTTVQGAVNNRDFTRGIGDTMQNWNRRYQR